MIVSLLSSTIYNPNFPILHPSSQTPFSSFEENERESERERDLFKCDHQHHPSFKFPHSPNPSFAHIRLQPFALYSFKGQARGKRNKKKTKKKKAWVLTDILLHWAARRRRSRRRRRRRQQQQGFFFPSVFCCFQKGVALNQKVCQFQFWDHTCCCCC